MQAKLFILIRNDIPLGDQGVQAGHGVGEWCKRWQYHGNQDWNNETLVYLTVKDLKHLLLWERKIEMKGLDYQVFYESDMQNEMTCIACFTDTNVFSNLDIWLKSSTAIE